MAIIYSIIATCEILGIDPEDYLKDILLRVAIRVPGQSVKDMSNLVMLAKLSGFDLSGVQLDLINLSDRHQAFMAREDISLSASTSSTLQVEKEIFRPTEGETTKPVSIRNKEEFLL
jgi:hypothetical protein